MPNVQEWSAAELALLYTAATSGKSADIAARRVADHFGVVLDAEEIRLCMLQLANDAGRALRQKYGRGSK